MSAIDKRFQQLRHAGQKAFMPFITAGDPSLTCTIKLIERLADAGADLLEVGFPYSDPIADGPVIQSSYTRALAHHVSVDQILRAVSQAAARVTIPLVAMVSYAIIYRRGVEPFVSNARDAGFSGLIVPDLLIEEADPLRSACRQADVSLIPLVTPTTPPSRAEQIARSATGFLYYVSVTGITGERNVLPADLRSSVEQLRQSTDVPVCVGFGISRPEHVELVAPVADGLIVGSALVRQLADVSPDQADSAVDQVADRATVLIKSLRHLGSAS